MYEFTLETKKEDDGYVREVAIVNTGVEKLTMNVCEDPFYGKYFHVPAVIMKGIPNYVLQYNCGSYKYISHYGIDQINEGNGDAFITLEKGQIRIMNPVFNDNIFNTDSNFKIAYFLNRDIGKYLRGFTLNLMNSSKLQKKFGIVYISKNRSTKFLTVEEYAANFCRYNDNYMGQMKVFDNRKDVYSHIDNIVKDLRDIFIHVNKYMNEPFPPSTSAVYDEIDKMIFQKTDIGDNMLYTMLAECIYTYLDQINFESDPKKLNEDNIKDIKSKLFITQLLFWKEDE